MRWLKLHVGGQLWTVDVVRAAHPDLDDGEGVCLFEKCRILISRDLSPEARDETLLHELLHAAMHVSGARKTVHGLAEAAGGEGDEAEERFVRGLTPVLHRLFRDMGFVFPRR